MSKNNYTTTYNSGQRTASQGNPKTSSIDKMASRLYRNMSPLAKIYVHLMSIFAGQTITQAIIKQELKRIASYIRTKKDSCFNVDNMTFNSSFANYIVDVNQAVKPFYEILDAMWSDKIFLGEVLSRIFFTDSDGNYNRRSIYDYCSLESLIFCYSETGTQDELSKLVNKSIRQINLTIPEYRYKEAETMLRPYQALYSLAKINYASFLELFNVSTDKEDMMDVKNASSKSVPLKQAYKYFAKFYLSIYSLLKETAIRSRQIKDDEEAEKSYLASKAGRSSVEVNDGTDAFHIDFLTAKFIFDTYSTYIGNGFDDTVELSTRLSDALFSLYGLVENFMINVPALSILRIAQGNPVYNFVNAITDIDIKAFYMEASNDIVMKEFDVVYAQVKETYFAEQNKKLFKNQKIINLANYNHIVTDDFDVINIFTYVRSLGVANTFLNWWLPNNLAPILQNLNNHVLGRYATLQAKIMDFITHIDTLIERINRLEAQLAPETEAGKILKTIQTTGSLSQLEAKQALNTIKNTVDSAASDTISNILSVLGELEKFLRQKVLNSNVENISAAIVAVYPTLNKEKLLSDLLTYAVNDIDIFIKLLKRLSEFENDKQFQ